MLGMGTNGNFYELRGESILEVKLEKLVFVIFGGAFELRL